MMAPTFLRHSYRTSTSLRDITGLLTREKSSSNDGPDILEEYGFIHTRLQQGKSLRDITGLLTREKSSFCSALTLPLPPSPDILEGYALNRTRLSTGKNLAMNTLNDSPSILEGYYAFTALSTRKNPALNTIVPDILEWYAFTSTGLSTRGKSSFKHCQSLP